MNNVLFNYFINTHLSILKQEFRTRQGECGPQIQNVTQTAGLLSLKDNNVRFPWSIPIH